MTRVLVTGATGFVGSTLCEHLAHRGYTIRAALRAEGALARGVTERCVVGDLSEVTDWTRLLANVDLIVHAAGRVHVLQDSRGGPERYMQVNAHSTGRLAQAAAHAGVRRFVFLSSVKVNGERTLERPFRPDDVPDPQDDYARSKLTAETLLREAAGRGGMEAVVVRPPLVYGAGVRANFLRLLRWVDAGRPLPFAAVHNQRSLVSVWNLSSLLAKLLTEPAAPGRVWMVSDGEDLSTPELIARLARALNRPPWQLRVPESVVRLCGRLAGRGAEIARLCDSLTVDTRETQRLLDWQPPFSVDEGLKRTVDWFRAGAN